MLRAFGYLFAFAAIGFVLVMAAIVYVVWENSQDLPDYEVLAQYEPPVTTRVHASDGALLAEYARERRLFQPIDAVPPLVINAFLAAEDKNFYTHPGVDFTAIPRVMITNIRALIDGRRMVGGSTITQQVAKNFLLSNTRDYRRKIQEALLSLRIESAFTKDEILELYLNKIYLGLGAHGIASAALNYFGKSVSELNIAEAAYLAALPKAPANYHPFQNRERAIERRNWVVERMAVNGFISDDEAEQAKSQPLDVTPRPSGTRIFAAEYFAEEVRRQLVDMFGEDKIYEGGLSVRTTLDPKLQMMARKALVDGLVDFDRKRGWRGPLNKIALQADWGAQLAELDALNDISPWRMAVVLDVSDTQALMGLRPERDLAGALVAKRESAALDVKSVAWARKKLSNGLGPRVKKVSEILSVGDVVYVGPSRDGQIWELMQVPEIGGAITVIDPHTGRVHALVGGFSHDRSQFNRATQALRQPGSSFKPFIYAAALDNGYTPSSVVMDAPVAIDQGAGLGIWRPQNYGREFYGPSTLRLGIEKSRNVMTVRLAQDMGMPMVSEYARRFGIYDDLPHMLAMSLGAGETTVMRLTAAYAMLANGGRKVTPSLIDRIQNRWGETTFRHDTRPCRGCKAEDWQGQDEPVLSDVREQILSEYSAYQVTSMLEGVIQRGTGTAIRAIDKPVAGKTGTTNDYRDAWFVGYSPDLAVGVFIGYDTPRSMGRTATGGAVAAPIFRDFMALALADRPAVPFRVPAGLELYRIDAKTGLRAGASAGKGVIMEAFKPGTAPPEGYSVIGYQGGSGGIAPDADQAISSGTGGLY